MEHGNDGGSSWLASFGHREAAKLRLVCFAHAGGNASGFARWPSQLGNEVEVWFVRLPGRESRRAEPLPNDLVDCARAVADAIDHLPEPRRKVALFGHSMGAWLAYETACAMSDLGRHASRDRSRQEDRSCCLLFVSGANAPQLGSEVESVAPLSDSKLIERVRSMGGSPQQVLDAPEWMRVMLPILRADFGMMERYRWRPREPLSCPVLAFGGADDPQTDRLGLNAWGERTSARFRLQMVAGDHFFHLRANTPVVKTMQRELSAAGDAR